MKKKYTETPLVDEYLQSLSGMKPAETNPFFYTRLKAKMGKGTVLNQPPINLKWAFAVCMLSIFLTINCWMLMHPSTIKKGNTEKISPQNFADVYGIGNALSY